MRTALCAECVLHGYSTIKFSGTYLDRLHLIQDGIANESMLNARPYQDELLWSETISCPPFEMVLDAKHLCTATLSVSISWSTDLGSQEKGIIKIPINLDELNQPLRVSYSFQTQTINYDGLS